MPLNSAPFYNKDADLTSRVFQWLVTGATEFYPAAPDDLWRYLSFVQIQFTLDPAGAAGTCSLSIIRENFAPPMQLWARHMLAGTDTTTPANLQSVEWMSDPNNYFVAPAGIAANGLIIPPRSQLRSARSGMSMIVEGVLHEAYDLDAIRGLT